MRFTYTEANLLPDDHEVNLVYNNFLEVFGEEGNLIVLGVKDTTLFSVKKFNAWNKFADSFKSFDEVETVLSIKDLQKLIKKYGIPNMDHLYFIIPKSYLKFYLINYLILM